MYFVQTLIILALAAISIGMPTSKRFQHTAKPARTAADTAGIIGVVCDLRFLLTIYPSVFLCTAPTATEAPSLSPRTVQS
jgi:hypothetical protein